MCRQIALPYEDVCMELWLLLKNGNIAGQGHYLDLLVNLRFFIFLGREIKERDHSILERTDGAKVCGGNTLFLGKGREPGHYLIARLEYKQERSLASMFTYQS